jgi:Uma2 family endonuclease
MQVAIEKITVEAYRAMEFDENDLTSYTYELIDGDIVKRNAPTPQHQRYSRLITKALDAFVTTNQSGEIFYSPIDVFLDDENAPQPDILFVPNAQAHIVTKNGIEGIPPLVVEIISPSSAYRDRVTKRALYERVGVAEYWLVDPVELLVEIFTLAEGRYQLLSAATPTEGILASIVLPGLVVDVAVLFG